MPARTGDEKGVCLSVCPSDKRVDCDSHSVSHKMTLKCCPCMIVLYQNKLCFRMLGWRLTTRDIYSFIMYLPEIWLQSLCRSSHSCGTNIRQRRDEIGYHQRLFLSASLWPVPVSWHYIRSACMPHEHNVPWDLYLNRWFRGSVRICQGPSTTLS